MSHLLSQTIFQLCRDYRGILAADESVGTIGKRFDSIGVENNRENRYAYRDMLFKCPNLNHHISGIITFEETLFDQDQNGQKLIQPLLDQGIIVGIKTDGGLKAFGDAGEQITLGLDDLEARSKKYYAAGARFAKWRCVYQIDAKKHLPTSELILKNAQTLAQYAKISQQCGLVPIVEPEVMISSKNTMEEVKKVTSMVLQTVYQELAKLEVDLTNTLLKPNMVRTEYDSSKYSSLKDYCQEVAQNTLEVLEQRVPKEVPGIVFLSGGMSEEQACTALNVINQKKNESPERYPWRLSFSYGRALQESVLGAWKDVVQGKEENCKKAEDAFQKLAQNNGLASMGFL